MNEPLSLLTIYLIAYTSATENEPNFEDICRNVAPGTTLLRPNTCVHWVRCPSSFEAADYDNGSCAYGLYFNKDIGRCDSMENVNCPYESDAVKNSCALKRDGTFLPHPNDCNRYIYCQNRKEINSACPKNLIFHPVKIACVYQKEYECKTKPIASNVNPICKAIPSNTLFADTKDCTKYNQCNEYNQLVPLECAEGQAFDYVKSRCLTQNVTRCHPLAPKLEPESDICGTEENVNIGYFADEKSCSKYFVCNKKENGKPDRKPIHEKCPNDYFFDVNTRSCRNRLMVKCHLERCEGIADGYVNVAGDCAAYAHCRNGVTINSGKCEEGYYFDERAQVCTQQNISYVACMP